MNSSTICTSIRVLSNSSIEPSSHETSTDLRMDNIDICIDNDISDLLQDNFGKSDGYAIQKKEDKFMEDFDDNLPLLVEIFEDLKKVESFQSNDKVNNKEYKSSEKEISLDEGKKYEKSPEKTVFEIQSEIEYKNELVRVEKLRKPKFQTLPACGKKGKTRSSVEGSRERS